MLHLRHAAAVIIWTLLAGTSAYAAQPVYRMTSECTMPTMPRYGSSKADWDAYATLTRDYNDCLSAKASRLGGAAKDKLEDVGNAVTDMADTAKGWFKR